MFEIFKNFVSFNMESFKYNVFESKSDDDIVGDLLNKESDTDDTEIDDEPIKDNVPT